jgi:rhodanese-related sulfurtransferase
MKNNKFYLLIVLFLAVSLILAGCNKEEDPITPDPVNESEVLLKYLEANGDFINTAAPALINAADVRAAQLADPSKIFIMDIRLPADFTGKGYIEGAVNVQMKDIVKYYKENNLASKEKVVISCYSGQQAGFATTVLRLLGYTNVVDLKYGMSAWNEQVANSWKPVVQNGNAQQSHFNTTPVAKNAMGNLPVLNTGKTTGKEILEARIEKILEEGFAAASINNATLFANLSNYYIVNYWPLAHYNFGHINGSIQYTPKEDLKLATNIKTLPVDKPIVVYCYTGQTSAHVAVFLRLLGYDAKSSLYGVNGQYYDLLRNNNLTTFTDNEIKNYPFIR